MEKNKFSAVEMTRKIRDDHAKRLVGKSHAERIAFYRDRAKKLENKLSTLFSELAKERSGNGKSIRDRHKEPDNQKVDTVLRQVRERRATYKKKK